MRIAYIVKRFPRVSETFIAQEVLELERRGVDVQVLALGELDTPAKHAWLGELRAPVRIVSESFADAWETLCRRRARPAGTPIVLRALGAALDCPPDRGRRFIGHASAIARVVEAEGIDHLHAHFADNPAAVAMLAHFLCGVPFSVTAHAKDIWVNRAGPAHWRRLIRHAAFVVAVSEVTRGHLVQLSGEERAHKIRHLYNGVDLDRLRPPDAPRNRDGPPTLLCVARLVEKKGVDVLLDACALVAGAGLPFRVEIVGDGPLADELHARADRLGIADRVIFVGAAAHEEVTRRMQASDVFVLPCRIASDGDRDTLPTVLIEAMACGLPCVSTPVGGVAEIVRDGLTGRLVAPDHPAALAEALNCLLIDERLRVAMGQNGRARAESHFDRARIVARLHGWFEAAALPRVRCQAAAGASA